MNKQRERELKKHIRRLKQRRTLVLVGESTGVTVDEINAEIEAIRVELGIAEDRVIANEYDIPTWQYIDLGHTVEEYDRLISEGWTIGKIALEWQVQKRNIHAWLKKKREESRMAKLTVEKYKELISKGLKASQIAEKTGLTIGSIYSYKAEWKKAGLLDDVEKKKEVVAEAKAIVADPVIEPIAEPVAKVEQKVDDSYKMLAQQYRDDLDKLGAELEREKEVSKRAVAELHEVQRERIQLHSETGELAEELANAAYEYAELKREYNMLVTIAKPFVEKFAKELAVKE